MTHPVRTVSPAVAEMAENWSLIDALMAGTPGMRKAGKTFLPQWPNENDSSYKARLTTAVLHPAFQRTVDVLASKPLSRAITLEDISQRVMEWASAVDIEGRNLHAFAGDLMVDCLSKGMSGVLIDYPRGQGLRTKAQERQVGIRPYFVRYPAGTVLGWKAKRVNSQLELTQLRLLEKETVDEGNFGERAVEQVRVLRPESWEVWRQNEKEPDEWFIHEAGAASLKRIPFVFFYGINTGFGLGRPPMLELAHQNVEHWQSSSDQQTILHVARVPILFMRGFEDDARLKIGASSAVQSKNPEAEIKYVEHTGAAIGAGRQAILDLEERMRQAGAEMLVRRPGKVTATQIRGEEGSQQCILQRIVEVFEKSLAKCLDLMALWVGEDQASKVCLYSDFSAADLGEASARILLDMGIAGKLSNETLFNEMQRRDLIAPGTDWGDESQRLPASEPPN